MGTELCRTLTRLGYDADVFAEPQSPAFYSRCCAQRLISPETSSVDFPAALRRALTQGYDAVFVCNEEILEAIMTLGLQKRCAGLVLPRAPSLELALSKSAMLQIAEKAGVAIPRTFYPTTAASLLKIAVELGFPLIVKGDRGEAGARVRLVTRPSELTDAYHQVAELEASQSSAPMVQEYIVGTGYSVGGLFHEGRPLRVCAHRKVVAVPPLGGLTVSGITESDPFLLGEACKIFRALNYTGLGHVEFIRDKFNRFRFLEINPRVWGTTAIAEYAGVDLFRPYQELARGIVPEPDLHFREGVRFHRIVREGRMIAAQPSRVFGFIRDCLDRQVRTDFAWSDPLPHLISLLGRSKKRLSKRTNSRERRLDAAIDA